MIRILERFLNVKFRSKLTRTYLLIAFIPFLIFTVASGSSLLGNVRQTTTEHTSQIVGQVSGSIDVYVGMMEKMANYIALTLADSPFWKMKSAANPDWDLETAGIGGMLRDIAESHNEIAGILVASEQDLFVSTGMSRISRDSFADEKWYRAAVETPDTLVLISNVTGRNIVTNKDYSVDDVFSLSKAIRDPATNGVVGVVLVDIRHDIIRKSINDVTIGQKGFVFVADQENNVVYTPANNIVYRVNPRWLHSAEPITARIGGERYQIRFEQSPYTGWKTVGVFSMDEVMSGLDAVRYLLIGCIGVTLLLVLAASVKLAGSVTTPILKLKSLMKQAESGDLTVRFEGGENDEIGELGNSFNHMIDRVDDLIHMVYVEQQNKRNAELKSLQEQIKPHFLYNTLDTISWMARDYDAQDIVHLVDALTSMFRIGLSHGKDFISVQEEMTHVSNYLYIQKIRYKDKLNYQIEISKELYAYVVPKLILQPLVENAIYHGIKQKRGGGTVTVTAGKADGTLTFRVCDNGAGIPPERVRQLNAQLHESPAQGEKASFGLFYIQERIRLCYGKEYGLRIASTQGIETSVAVTLPLTYRDGRKMESV